MPIIERYTPAMERQWNELVENSRNATFLFDRRYMDYHSDRFEDFSLVAIDDRGRLMSALPANREGDTIVSHRGLTYGGWILPARHCDMMDMMSIWNESRQFLHDEGFKTLIYKPVPHIYHAYPAEEDLYAIFRAGGRLAYSQVSSVVDLQMPMPFGRRLGQMARKALKSDINFGESNDWQGYWALLTAALQQRHNTNPVHSLAEIELLRQRFPEQIRLFTATANDEILAGAVMFITPQVAHLQYSGASANGMMCSAVPALYQWLIDYFSGKARWFDFGTSNEQNGAYLNEGLMRLKCSCGGRAVVYNTFEINL